MPKQKRKHWLAISGCWIVLDKYVSQTIQLTMKTIHTTDVFDAWFESLHSGTSKRPVGFRLALIVLKTEILRITSRWVTVCLK